MRDDDQAKNSQAPASVEKYKTIFATYILSQQSTLQLKYTLIIFHYYFFPAISDAFVVV
jgi:hypothetical protein